MNETIKNLVITRLSAFGVTPTEADSPTIDYSIEFIALKIKNFCNIEEIPQELNYEWANAVCADFLKMKLSTGSLENVAQIVKSIQEGDTTVSYSESGTPESQLLECITQMGLNLSGLIRFRKMVW